MKASIASFLLATVLAPAAFARHGGDDGTPRGEIGTPGWLQHESLEHSRRLLAVSDGAGAVDALTAQAAAVVDAATATVVLTLASGEERAFTCKVVDEWSRRGTVLKKDVRCLAD